MIPDLLYSVVIFASDRHSVHMTPMESDALWTQVASNYDIFIAMTF